MKTKFINLKQQFNDEKITVEASFNKLSNLRLIVFIMILASFFFGMKYNILILLVPILLVIFVILLNKHSDVSDRLKNINYSIDVIDLYIDRINGEMFRINNKGTSYINNKDLYLADLDIFGDNSLFMYINQTGTKLGEIKLASYLTEGCCDIDSMHEAVDEIVEKDTIKLEAELKKFSKEVEDKNANTILNAISKYKIEKINFSFLKFILPIIFISSIIATLIDANNAWLIVLAAIINFGINNLIKYTHSKNTDIIYIVSSELANYQGIFKTISELDFKTTKLKNIKETVISAGINSSKQVAKLRSLYDFAKNPIANFIMNCTGSLNINLICSFNKWYNEYASTQASVFDAISELEVIISYSVINKTKEVYCKPKFTNDTIIKFSEIYHPLITKNVVKNTHIASGSNIITGSNMSGKTSFLRTIGVNQVLARAGCYVCAREYITSDFTICTSMRITDDLTNGISTFYREILRIKSIIEEMNKGQKMLVLLDEIFRGTNSNDRLIGAKTLIEKLTKDNIILYVTTHDKELCELEKQGIRNYHFTEKYIKDKITFDYLIKDGACNTTNAIYLMRMANIID